MNNILESGKDYTDKIVEDFCEKAFEGQFSSQFLRTVEHGASLYEVTHLPTGHTFPFTMGSAYNRGPTVTEIMYGLCADYQTAQMDYHEFLDNFGFEEGDDSRAFYEKCRESGERYQAILNCDKNEWIDSDLFQEMINHC